MKRIGIRQQVALLTLIPSLIMVVCLETWFLHDRFAAMDENLLGSGKLIAAQLAASSEYGVFSSNQLFLQKIARNTLEQPDVRGILILNSASETLVRAGRFSGQVTGALGFSQNAHSDSAIVGPLSPITGDERNLWIYHPIISEQIPLDDIDVTSAPQSIGAVVVEMSKLDTEQIKTRMLWGTMFATAVFLNLVMYIVYRASRSITYPVRQLSWAMQTIGEGDLGTHVSLKTRIQELDMLANGLNRMVGELREERGILEQRIKDATQALRIKKEEAERASHDKSRFLAIASHDLRQPLHALGLYVGELQRKVSSDEQRKLVGQIDYSIEALSTLLNALLDISKLDAGAIVPKIQPCDVRTMLEHIAADFHMLAVIKEIRLVVHHCPEFVTSDPVLLERILTNLVSNAIRYTSPGGCVMIACRRRGKLLRIEVRDNGIGIPKEKQAEIFWEFFQLNQQRQDANKGLGLGLSIVDRLVKLLGHHLHLRSASGKGSVFAIEAPRTPYLVKFDGDASGLYAFANSGLGADTMTLTGKRVLVVDDDAAVLSSTSGLLKSWGCDVSGASSLPEVEQLLHNGLICDFIVTDYQLGNDATGLGVIDIVRQRLGQAIPCILISGDTSLEVIALAKKNGITLLHKPLKPAKLRSLLIHFLSAPSDSPPEYDI